MNSEQERFSFLCNRDGLHAAIEWEIQAAVIYGKAAAHAMDPDTRGGAKGREWAETYRKARSDCLEVIRIEGERE